MIPKEMSPREKRLLNELGMNEKVSVKDLRSRIGALNPAQSKLMLVRRGWVIRTGYNAVHDRDGNLCRPGFYWMEPQERERARRFLEEANRAAGPALSVDSASEQSTFKTSENNHTNGGRK